MVLCSDSNFSVNESCLIKFDIDHFNACFGDIDYSVNNQRKKDENMSDLASMNEPDFNPHHNITLATQKDVTIIEELGSN